MAKYQHVTTGEIRDIGDDTIVAWSASGNPKQAFWSLIPDYDPEASSAPVLVDGEWSITPLLPDPDYKAFSLALASSNIYASKLFPLLMSDQASPAQLAALSIYGITIEDGKSGRIPKPQPGDPPDRLQVALCALYTVLEPMLTEDDTRELNRIMMETNMSHYYFLGSLAMLQGAPPPEGESADVVNLVGAEEAPEADEEPAAP